MKKMVYILAALAIGAMVSCSSSGDSSKVTINFGQNPGLPYITGPSQESVNYPGVPEDVKSISVYVYASEIAAENRIFSETFEIDPDSPLESITVDIPSGAARIFVIEANNWNDELSYQGISDPYDLEAGQVATLSISIVKIDLGPPDATVTVNLYTEDIDDTVLFTDPDYPVTYTAAVYTQVIGEGESLDLGGEVEGNDTLTGLTLGEVTSRDIQAYSNTWQILVIKAETSDGAVAWMGGAIPYYLDEGSNDTINIWMQSPAKVNLTLLSSGVPYTGAVTLQVYLDGAGPYDIDTFVSWTNSVDGIGLPFPSSEPWFNADDSEKFNRTIRVNGVDVLVPYLEWGDNNVTVNL